MIINSSGCQSADQDKMNALKAAIKLKYHLRFPKTDANSDNNMKAISIFSTLFQNLASNNTLIMLDLSGCNLNTYNVIDIMQFVENNNKLQSLNLASCNLSSFSLSYLFQVITQSEIQYLNLFNNQNFTPEVVQNFCQYILKGNNKLREINLNHCNISPYQLSLILQNIKHHKKLIALHLSMMQFNYEVLITLSIMLQNYTNTTQLEYLDLSYNNIGNSGIEVLYQSTLLHFGRISINKLNLSGNHISQESCTQLELILLKFKQFYYLDLSRNKLKEFTNNHFKQSRINSLNLSQNLISEIPNDFFLNVLALDLSANNINVAAAYQISQLLSKTQWISLNLNNNEIGTKGFISIVYALTENTILRTLSVANNKIHGQGILVYILNHHILRITQLNLSENFIRTELALEMLHQIQKSALTTLLLENTKKGVELEINERNSVDMKFSNITYLSLSGNPDVASKVLSSLRLQSNRIVYLNLNNNYIQSSNIIQDLCNLISNSTTLTELILSHNKIGQWNNLNLQLLKQALTYNKSINYLDLSNNCLRSAFGILSKGIRKCNQLCSINLSNNYCPQESRSIMQLAKIIRNNSIVNINLSGNRLNQQFFYQLRLNVGWRSQPFSLNLSKCEITGNQLKAIRSIIEVNTSITMLNLSGNLTFDHFDFLLENSKLSNVRIVQPFPTRSYVSNLVNLLQNNLQVPNQLTLSSKLPKPYTQVILEQIGQMNRLHKLTLQNQILLKHDELLHFGYLLNILQELTLNNCIFDHQNAVSLKQFLSKSQILIYLEFTHTRLGRDNWLILCDGIGESQSIKVLNMDNNNFQDEDIFQLIQAFMKNISIQSLSLNHNKLTNSSAINLIQQYIKKGKKCNLQQLNLGSNLIKFPLQYPNPNELQLDVFPLNQLATLNLSSNYFDPTVNPNELLMKSLITLNLNGCHLKGDLTTLFKQLPTTLRNLYLWNNHVDINEVITLIQKYSMEIQQLDLGKNQINDSQISRINIKNLSLPHLRVMLMNENEYTSKSNSVLLQLMRGNNLYIYNKWKNVTDVDGLLIIQQYLALQNQFKIDKSKIPFYLKCISITESKLSDTFCTELSQQFGQMPYIEELILTNNSSITQSGRSLLYITFIEQCYNAHSLKIVDINKTKSTIFDDGILPFSLIKLKLWLCCTDSQAFITSATSLSKSIRFGCFGKVINQLVNIILDKLSDRKQQQFCISEDLYHIVLTNSKMYRWALIQTFGEVAKILGCGLVFIVPMRQYKELNFEGCLNDQGCFVDDLNLYFQYLALLILMSTSYLEFYNLRLFIHLRQEIKQDYPIATHETREYQLYPYPHKRELYQTFFQFFVRLNFLIGTLLLYVNMQLEELADVQWVQLLSSINYWIITLKCLQISYNLTLSFRALIQLRQKNLYKAQSLKLLWRKAMHDSNHVALNFLSSYCPQAGIWIGKCYFNLRQVNDAILAFVFELNLVLIFLYSLQLRQRIFTSMGYGSVLMHSDIYILIAASKGIVQIILSLWSVLTSRPPDVRLCELNQALIVRGYLKSNTLGTVNLNSSRYYEVPQDEAVYQRIETVDPSETTRKLKLVYDECIN